MCFEWNEGGYIFIFGWHNPFVGVNSARARCMCHHAIGSQSISTAVFVCMRAHGRKSVLFPSNISHVAGTVPREDQTPVICHGEPLGAVWCLVWSWQACRPRAVLSICLSSRPFPAHTTLYDICLSSSHQPKYHRVTSATARAHTASHGNLNKGQACR